MSRRPPKKSETLEVRIPHEVKHALMRKADAEGRSASEVVRSYIDSYLAGQPKQERSMLISLWKPAAVVGLGSFAIIWAAIAPVPSQAKPDLKTAFQMFDRNHDGAISTDEFIRDTSDPAVQQMHHEHMKGAADKAHMDAMHAQMQAAHGHPTDAAIRSHFAQLDANSDGSVTLAEFRAFHDKMVVSHGGH